MSLEQKYVLFQGLMQTVRKAKEALNLHPLNNLASRD